VKLRDYNAYDSLLRYVAHMRFLLHGARFGISDESVETRFDLEALCKRCGCSC
jgi:hypothetical protein